MLQTISGGTPKKNPTPKKIHTPEKIPTPKKIHTPKKIPKKKSPPFKKNSTTSKVNIPQRKKKNAPRRIFYTDEDYLMNVKCTYDHEDMSSYKEESDRRYFKDNESELFGTCCASCHVAFDCERNVDTSLAVQLARRARRTHNHIKRVLENIPNKSMVRNFFVF